MTTDAAWTKFVRAWREIACEIAWAIYDEARHREPCTRRIQLE